MRTSKQRLLVFVLGMMGAFALFHKLVSPASGSVRYHLQKLGQLNASQAWKWGPSERRPDSAGRPVPANTSSYANPKTWIWYLKGRPTITSHVEEQEKHQEALIRLGYFERRELTFSHRRLDAQLWSDFRTAVSNAPLTEPHYMLQLDESRPTVIRVTTSKLNIPVFERITAQIDNR